MVLATQCLLARRWETMLVSIEGALQPGVSAKDLALAVVRRLGIGGEPATPSSSPARRCARSA